MSKELQEKLNELSIEIDSFNAVLDKISNNIKITENLLKPVYIIVEKEFEDFKLIWFPQTKRFCISEFIQEKGIFGPGKPVSECKIDIRIKVEKKLLEFLDEVKFQLNKNKISKI